MSSLARALALCRQERPVRPLFALAAGALAQGLALLLLALRWHPLTFAYHDSGLGILSPGTLAHYPAQQESFHVALALAVPLATALACVPAWLWWAARATRDPASFRASLTAGARAAPACLAPLAWVLFVPWPRPLAALAWFSGPLALVVWRIADAAARPPPSPSAPAARDPARDALEAAHADAIPPPDEPLCVGAGAAVGAFLSMARGAAGREPALCALAGAIGAAGALACVAPRERLARLASPLVLLLALPYVQPLGIGPAGLALAVVLLAAAAALEGGLPRRAAGALVVLAIVGAVTIDPTTVMRVSTHRPDLDGVAPGYSWFAEHGQRLEWADRWIAGEVPGRDFLFLYGPLQLDLMRGGFALFGRSHAALLLVYHLQDLAGFLSVAALALAVFRTRLFAVVALLCAVPIYLRSGGAALAFLGLASDLPLAWGASGAVLALSALYSQEFAVAQALASLVLIACRGGDARRRLAGWIAGGLATAAPLALYLHARGALIPSLTAMVTYPRWMFAGFGKVPYPALTAMLPLAGDAARYLPLRAMFGKTLVAFYALPCAYLAGLAAVAVRRVARVPATRREALVAAIATHGVISFRAGLGHACLGHQEAILWPAVLLGALTVEALARTCPAPSRPLIAAVLACLLCIQPAWLRFDAAWRGFESGRVAGYTGLLSEWIPAGGPRADEIRAVIAAVRATTPEGAPLLALPNGSAYHFYTGRPNPTAFATFALLITDEHRREAVAACTRRPPACVIYDLATPRLDDLPDGPQLDGLLDLVCRRYEVRRLIGSTLLLYPLPDVSLGQQPPAVAFESPAELARRLAQAPPGLPFRIAYQPGHSATPASAPALH